MQAGKRRRLARAGWTLGSAEDFLGLTPEEASFIELKLRLSHRLRRWRQQHALTQGELARRLGSSQSRVAKMEAGDATVSLDLLVRSLFRLGVTRREVVRAMG